MGPIYDFLHHQAVAFTKWVRVFLEFAGALVILYVSVIVLFRFFKLKFRESCTDLRIRLGRGIAMALMLYLAGELLRLITTWDYKDLIIVGGIVVLHVVISILVSWEVGHSLKLIEEEEAIEHKSSVKDKDKEGC